MKNINKYMLAIILFITFTFTCMSDVKAGDKGYSSDKKCSDFFEIIDVNYDLDEDDYNGGRLYIDQFFGNEHIYKDTWTNLGKKNTTTWIYEGGWNNGTACVGGDMKFVSEDKLILEVKENGKVKCKETISEFDTTKTIVKVTLFHKTRRWYHISGNFDEYTKEGNKCLIDFGDNKDGRINVTLKIDGYPEKDKTPSGQMKFFISGRKDPTESSPKLVYDVIAQDSTAWYELYYDTKSTDIKATATCTMDGKTINPTVSSSTPLLRTSDAKGNRIAQYDLRTQIDFSNITDWNKKKIICDIHYEIPKESGIISTYDEKVILNNGAVTKSNYGNEEQPKDKNGNTVVIPDTNVSNNSSDSDSGSVIAGTTDPIKMSIGGSTKIDCGDGKEGTLKWLIDEYWRYIMIAAPILLIVMMSIEVVKAMVTSDADLLKKLVDSFVKRTLATIILLCLPVIIRTILGIFGIDICL